MIKFSAAAFLEELVRHGSKAGYAEEDGFPVIPELTVRAPLVVRQMMSGIQNSNYIPSSVEAEMSATLAVCAFAGMGAALLWYTDQDVLNRKGIFDALTQARGIFVMDEYVTDLIGIGYGTEESEQLNEHLGKCIGLALGHVRNASKEKALNRGSKTYQTVCEAMFLYGVVMEVRRLRIS